MKMIRILGVVAVALGLAAVAPAAYATTEPVHEVTLDADSHCDFHTGNVVIEATLLNDGSESVSVSATDVTFSGTTVGPVTIAAGEAHTFEIIAGVGPLPGGTVRYDLVWANGETESVTANHSPTNGCGPSPSETTPPPTTSTPPPTTTTPPPTTTTPPPTTSSPPPTTSTPPPTSSTPPPTTTTSTTPPPTTPPDRPKCQAHPDRPACRTTPPIAFTGPAGPSPITYAAVALALLVAGTGLMRFAHRRGAHRMR